MDLCHCILGGSLPCADASSSGQGRGPASRPAGASIPLNHPSRPRKPPGAVAGRRTARRAVWIPDNGSSPRGVRSAGFLTQPHSCSRVRAGSRLLRNPIGKVLPPRTRLAPWRASTGSLAKTPCGGLGLSQSAPLTLLEFFELNASPACLRRQPTAAAGIPPLSFPAA